MNVTFIALDGQGVDLRYLTSARNRGNSSRTANPPNYRLSFPADRPWRDINAHEPEYSAGVSPDISAARWRRSPARWAPIRVR